MITKNDTKKMTFAFLIAELTYALIIFLAFMATGNEILIIVNVLLLLVILLELKTRDDHKTPIKLRNTNFNIQ